jgi:tRNA A37 threonylcarbamoyladenosine modification protein TsaB
MNTEIGFKIIGVGKGKGSYTQIRLGHVFITVEAV